VIPYNLRRTAVNAAEEDDEVFTLLFNWKLQTTRNAAKRSKEQARDIVMDNDWSIHDLKLMEDGQSAIYHRAIKVGISDSFARWFRKELWSLKEAYQRQRGNQEAEAINVLNSLLCCNINSYLEAFRVLVLFYMTLKLYHLSSFI
jgi:hypothetical protein